MRPGGSTTAIIAFVAVVLVVVALALLWEGFAAWRSRRAVTHELRRLGNRETGDGAISGLLLESDDRGVSWLEPLLLRFPRRHDLQHFLDQSDIGWSVGTYLLLTFGIAAAAGLGLLAVSRTWPLPTAGVVLGALIPYFIVSRKRKKRFAAFEEHFPNAIDLLGRAIRAGHAFSTGLRVVAEEAPPPISGEFRQVYEEQKFGLPLPESLLAFADRMTILDVRIFVTAVLIQLESGGNLAEILDNLAHIIRERFRFRRQLKTHTAHGRMTGMVLAAAPIVAGLGMFALNPDYVRLLFDEPLGRMMLAGAATLQLLGFLTIRRIVNIDF